MGNYTIFKMFVYPGRGRQARNFTTNAPKNLDLKSSSTDIFRKLTLDAPGNILHCSSSPEKNRTYSASGAFHQPSPVVLGKFGCDVTRYRVRTGLGTSLGARLSFDV